MTIREVKTYVLSCNHDSLSAGLCKAQLTVEAFSQEAAIGRAREMGWESILSRHLCAGHRNKPVRACPADGTVMRVEQGAYTCRQGHKQLRGELVLPC
jgi:hypothetical protein